MTPYEIQLAIDFAQLDAYQLEERYYGKIQGSTTISGEVSALEKHGILNTLIRTDWRNDGRDKDGVYLIHAGDRFQVFRSERGIKLDLKEYSDLRLACTNWVSWMLYALGYDPSDSSLGS